MHVQGKTQPPDYLSESELIGLMERHGIGTDASIAVHINNICERNYVRIQGGRRVVPTELGITLVRGYQLIDPELCSPQARPACPHAAMQGVAMQELSEAVSAFAGCPGAVCHLAMCKGQLSMLHGERGQMTWTQCSQHI